MIPNPFASALAEQIAKVVGALVDGQATAAAAEPAPARGAWWVVTLAEAADGRGSCTVAFEAAAATAATQVITGVDTTPPDAVVADTLREIVAQALGALASAGEAGEAGDVAVDVARPALESDHAPGADDVAITVAAPALPAPLVLVFAGAIDPTQPRAARDATATPAADRIDVILDIELPLVVRFGRTELPLRQLAKMGPGSLIDLGRSADDPVELLVSNRVVARGEVVVVGGNYGVRVLDVVSPRDRVRSMEV